MAFTGSADSFRRRDRRAAIVANCSGKYMKSGEHPAMPIERVTCDNGDFSLNPGASIIREAADGPICAYHASAGKSWMRLRDLLGDWLGRRQRTFYGRELHREGQIAPPVSLRMLFVARSKDLKAAAHFIMN